MPRWRSWCTKSVGHRREGVERDDFAPGSPPALANYRVFLAPEAFLECGKRSLAGGGIDSSVDALERSCHRFTIFPGDEIEAVAQEVNDAGLHRRLRENG